MQQPQGFLRLAKPPKEALADLGPLKDLPGTWLGSHGWNLIAVPDGQGFKLEVMPYVETITFTPIGALVPNKDGTPGFMKIPGVQYELRVADVQTNQPLHIETGMWLRLNFNVDPTSNSVARLSTIPHGDSLLAMGSYSTIAGPPPIADISSLPDTGQPALPGYTDPYLTPNPNFDKVNPNKTLQDAIKGQKIVETVTLVVSTSHAGGIVNIPYIVKHADAKSFESIFWIETVENAPGETFLQLQYSQRTDLFFLPRFGPPPGLIRWPHINVNTLVKQ